MRVKFKNYVHEIFLLKYLYLELNEIEKKLTLFYFIEPLASNILEELKYIFFKNFNI